MLALAIVLITLALVAYTVGVWAERRSGELRWWHVAAFGLGLAADVSGTLAMSSIANGSDVTQQISDGFLTGLMAVTGALALALMALHLAWAVVVMLRNRVAEKRTFHRFSVIVWAIWLVPYFSGMAAAML